MKTLRSRIPSIRALSVWLALAAVPFVGIETAEGQDQSELAEVRLQAPVSEQGSAILASPARLEIEDVSLREALDALQRSSGVAVAYSSIVLPRERSVTCYCAEATIEDALAEILRETNLEPLVTGGQVVVRERRTPTSPLAPPRAIPESPVALAANSRSLGSTLVATLRRTASAPPPRVRQGTITGTVVQAQNLQPLGSAQVHIPALGVGTLTASDGSFTLADVPAGTHMVRAELIGFRAAQQEITVGDGETLEVSFQLESDALALDEILVTGTVGGAQRRAIGNVVDQVNVAEIREMSPSANIEQLLANRAPGLTVMPGAGIPGADATRIRLRGSTSTALSNDPIVYVDGIRINNDTRYAGTTGAQSRLNDINPADIESVEVIKGPAAATLYGTEASAGVIQIITRRGAAMEPVFDARVELGANYLPNPERRFNDNWAVSPVDGSIISHNLVRDREEEGMPIFETGLHQNYDFSVRGGTDLIRYRAGVGRSDREGTQRALQWDKRTSARGNLGVTARDNLSIDAGASWSSSENRFGSHSGGIIWGTPGTRAAVGGADDPRQGFSGQPPEISAVSGETLTFINRTAWNATVDWQPFEWMSTRSTVGTDYTREDRTSLSFRRGPDMDFSNEGSRSISNRETQITTVDLSGTAAFRFMDGRFGTENSIGFQYFNREIWDQSASGSNFATAALTTVSSAATTDGGEDFLQNVTVGAFGQIQLDWDQRMFLTAAVRADDNSAFGAEFDAAIYPKLSGTWVLSEEEFFDVYQVDQLRLRGAWGQAGRQPDVLDAARLYTAVTGPGDQPTITPLAFGSPDLGPEEGSELELGFDATFFGDRVNVNFTRWWKTTTDAIVSRPLGPSIGFAGAQLVNIGEIRNWGSETEVDLEVVRAMPVRWDLGLSFARMKNRVEDLGEGLESMPVRRGRQHRVGYPLASIFEYVVHSADFVEGDSGPVTNMMCDGGAGPDGLRAGGELVPCEDAPRLYYGHAEPTWVVNLNSTVTIGQNLRINTMIDARGGHAQIQDAYNARHTSFSNTEFAVRENDPIVQSYRQLRRDRLGFHKGGFARLREVGVNYTLPAEWVHGFGADRVSLNVAGRNVATPWRQMPWTDVGPQRISDPETNLPSEEFPGESTTVMPPIAQIIFSMNVSF